MIDWHYPRTDLARQYMAAFESGITGALAIFAPRRMGKSEFVLLDLAPEAESRGYQVGYCSFWNLQDNPAKALRISLESISQKGAWREKWASYVGGVTSEISAELAGTSVKVKSGGQATRVEEDDLVAIIQLIAALSKKRKPTLLLLDEVQHLANVKFASLVATLRTQFEEHRKKIHVVYTGSSRDGLQRMFRDRKAPMFHSAQQVEFPHLGTEFVVFMLEAFYKASTQKLSLVKSKRVFEQMNRNPALFHHLLRHMLIHGIWDISEGFEAFNALADIGADYEATWNTCKPAAQAVLRLLVSEDIGPYSEEGLKFVAEEMGVESVTKKTVQNALEYLRKDQIVFNSGRGQWDFEDQAFRQWVKDKHT